MNKSWYASRSELKFFSYLSISEMLLELHLCYQFDISGKSSRLFGLRNWKWSCKSDWDHFLFLELSRVFFPSLVFNWVLLHVFDGSCDGMKSSIPSGYVRSQLLLSPHDLQLLSDGNIFFRIHFDRQLFHLNVWEHSSLILGSSGFGVLGVLHFF